MKSEPLSRMVYQTDETRQRILTTARALFTERGLFDTQMTDVAAALGLSRTTLYRYFRDKLDLAVAILGILMAEVHAVWRDPGPPASARDRVGLYLRQVWGGQAVPGASLRFLAEFDAFFSGSRIPEGFASQLAGELPPGGDAVLLALLAEGQADGSIRADLDGHLAMATLLNAVRGLQQRLILRAEVLVELRPQEADRMIGELVTYLLRGLAPEPRAP